MGVIYFCDWENLPGLIILEIYQYLDDKEKLNMSLTCKRWGSLFHSACLWRIRHFDMCRYDLYDERKRAKMFVEQHGAHVRYLTISCDRPYDTNELFLRSVGELMSSRLRDSRLSEFNIKLLQLDHFRIPAPSQSKFLNQFIRFLKQQKHVQVFDMTSAEFTLNSGIRVLDTVATKCGSLIEKLFIEDFFSSRTALFQIEKFKKILTHFSNLNYLAINYSCLSDSVLEIFTKNLVGLKTIKIKVCKNNPHTHRISSQTWKQMVTCFPALSVSFGFDSVCHWFEIIPILQREIPVTNIQLWTGYEVDTDGWGLTRTINHIVECYRNSLESVSFVINNYHEFVDEAILRLVGTCKKLRDVGINAVISLDTIRSILEQQGDNIHSVNITACGVTQEGGTMEIEEDYANPGGLNLDITTDVTAYQLLQLINWG